MPSKYDAINKLKAENPELTWTQAANQAGFEGEWTSYKGKAKPRTGDARGQARRRARFDQPSTEMVGYEAKRLQQESTRISAEAEMFGLEPTQIEHLADQDDSRAMTSGAPGDPTNKLIVTQSEARLKDTVKQAAGSDFATTINPSTESIRVIPKQNFDPIADPATLPGIDISIAENLNAGFDQIRNLLAKLRKPTARFGQVLTDLKDISQQAVDVKAQRMMDPERRMAPDPKLMGPGGLGRQAVKEIAEELIFTGGQTLVNQVTGSIAPKPRSKKR